MRALPALLLCLPAATSAHSRVGERQARAIALRDHWSVRLGKVNPRMVILRRCPLAPMGRTDGSGVVDRARDNAESSPCEPGVYILERCGILGSQCRIVGHLLIISHGGLPHARAARWGRPTIPCWLCDGPTQTAMPRGGRCDRRMPRLRVRATAEPLLPGLHRPPRPLPGVP